MKKVVNFKTKTMREIDSNKHTKESLTFIFNEALRLNESYLKSISATVNRSYIMFAFFCTILTFSFFHVLNNEKLYFILILGMITCMIAIRKNIFPSSITFSGSLPDKMVDEYFDNFSGESLIKEQLIVVIENYDIMLKKNKLTVSILAKRYLLSIWILVVSILIFGTSALIPFIVSFISIVNGWFD